MVPLLGASSRERQDIVARQLQGFYDVDVMRFGDPGDWQGANAIDSMATYARKNRSVLPQLRSTFDFITKEPPTNLTTPDNWGQCHDDVMWGAFAWMRLYTVDQDIKYVERAALYFEWIVENEMRRRNVTGDENSCVTTKAGKLSGIYACPYLPGSTVPDKPKNTITNTQFFTLAMRLHPFAARLGKPKAYYLEFASDTWRWLGYANLQSKSGLWNDGIDQDTCNNTGDVTFTYNQGVLLPGVFLYAEATGQMDVVDVAHRTLNGVFEYLAYGSKVIHEPYGSENSTESEDCTQFWGGPCRQWAIFKGIFVRHLMDFVELLPEGGSYRSKYTELIEASAASAWTQARCGTSANASFTHDWYGVRPDKYQSCNPQDPFTNMMAQTSAALDLFNAASLLA